MAVSATYRMDLTVRETIESGVDGVTVPVITHNGFNATGTINATSAVPATKTAVDTIALAAGVYTIDLTTLTGAGGAAVTFNGLKVQAVKFINNGAAAMTFTFGASNGYLLLGTGWKIILPPGGSFQTFLNEGAPDVDGTHKTIDVSGTGTETFSMVLVAG